MMSGFQIGKAGDAVNRALREEPLLDSALLIPAVSSRCELLLLLSLLMAAVLQERCRMKKSKAMTTSSILSVPET